MTLRSDATFVSLAQQVEQFQRKTPKRFRSKPKGAQQPSPVEKSAKHELTRPVGFAFRTAKRSRPVHVPEPEKPVLFQARPVPEEIFQQPKPKRRVNKAELTCPVEFDFQTAKRARVVHGDDEEEEEQSRQPPMTARSMPEGKAALGASQQSLSKSGKLELTRPVEFHLRTTQRVRPVHVPEPEPVEEFHARPLPQKILEEPDFVPQPSARQLTEPHTPSLRTRKRAAERPHSPVFDENSVQFKARDMPHMDTPLREKLEAQAAQRAALVTLTEPQPFNLETEMRGQIAQQVYQQQLEQEMQEDKKRRNFKARPILQATFELKKSNAPLTEVSNFELNSDTRSQKRREFDEHLKQKEAELAALRAEQERLQKQQEEEEIRELRKQLVHKARPAPKSLRASQRSLTSRV